MITSSPGTHRRVAVITPTARVDLAVPQDLSVADLVPVVLELARSPDAGTASGWRIGKVGHPALSPEHSLAESGVRDGDLLDLRPEQLVVPQLVFDEITDVAAAIAAENAGSRVQAGRVAGLLTAAVLLGAATAWTWWHGAAGGAVGAALAVTVLVTAVVVARRVREETVRTGMGVSAIGLAAGTAARAAPPGGDAWLAAGGVLLVAGIGVALAVRTGVAVFTLLSATGAMLLAGAAAARLSRWPIHHIATVAVVVAVSLIPWVPRMAARIAGLRPGVRAPEGVPLSGPRLAAAMTTSRRAVRMVAGLDAACACAVGVGAVILVRSVDGWSISLAVVGPVVLLLRAGSTDVVLQAAALAVPAALGLLGVGAELALRVPDSAREWVPVVAAVMAAIVLWLSNAEAQRIWPPLALRLRNVAEGALVLAVVPIGVAAVEGYSWLRHL